MRLAIVCPSEVLNNHKEIREIEEEGLDLPKTDSLISLISL
jgi:hypothetical protein